MSWLTLLNTLVELFLRIVRYYEKEKREQTEQEIKENPREFFNKGNLPNNPSSDDDGVQPPATKE